MLKHHWRFISNIERIIDNVLILLSFFITYYKFRNLSLDFYFSDAVPHTQLGEVSQYYIILGATLAFSNVFLPMFGAYRSMRLSTFLGTTWIIIKSFFCVFLFTGAILYLLKLDLSRSLVIAFIILSILFLLAERIITLCILRFFRLSGKNFRNVLLIGISEQTADLYKELISKREYGINVTGLITLNKDKINKIKRLEAASALPPVLGDHRDLEDILSKFAVDEIIFTSSSTDYRLLACLSQIAISRGVDVSICADIFGWNHLRYDIISCGNIPLLKVSGLPQTSRIIIKRLLDIIISALAIIVLAPFLIVIAILIKREDGGTIFFKQKRVGLHGRIFNMLKFRSMVVNAESLLSTLKEQNEKSGPIFKMKNDPRMTRIGRFIRKYSIDELPQLLNVFLGDMSIVGPRPPIPDEVSVYEREQQRRLSMRPGLTCIWQVEGRDKVSDFSEMARLDLEYIDNWSLLGDLKLILKTIPVVLRGSGM